MSAVQRYSAPSKTFSAGQSSLIAIHSWVSEHQIAIESIDQALDQDAQAITTLLEQFKMAQQANEEILRQLSKMSREIVELKGRFAGMLIDKHTQDAEDEKRQRFKEGVLAVKGKTSEAGPWRRKATPTFEAWVSPNGPADEDFEQTVPKKNVAVGDVNGGDSATSVSFWKKVEKADSFDGLLKELSVQQKAKLLQCLKSFIEIDDDISMPAAADVLPNVNGKTMPPSVGFAQPEGRSIEVTKHNFVSAHFIEPISCPSPDLMRKDDGNNTLQPHELLTSSEWKAEDNFSVEERPVSVPPFNPNADAFEPDFDPATSPGIEEIPVKNLPAEGMEPADDAWSAQAGDDKSEDQEEVATIVKKEFDASILVAGAREWLKSESLQVEWVH